LKEAAKLLEGEGVINNQCIMDEIYSTEMTKVYDKMGAFNEDFKEKPFKFNYLEVNLR
jgi:hypothetical protein